ncbi:MAG: hypothetical protein GKS01_19430 [Alphaproteobacteria bacterium]|nr:hypothetical protein [Alphaproteobacteria bacterium]
MNGPQEKDPIIPYADTDSLTGDLKTAVDAYIERMGFLPNALKLYMHRPELLACLIRLNNTVMRDDTSHLDAGLKRRLAAVCSALNESDYCVAHNSNTLKTDTDSDGEGWGFTADDVAALLDDSYAPEGPLEQASFDYARAATLDPTNVPEAVIHTLNDVLTPPQVAELAVLVGFWKMYNSIHESLHIPIEQELLADI